MKFLTDTERGFMPLSFSLHPAKALQASVVSWLAVALLGQWMFAFYIMTIYVFPIATGNFAQVNRAQTITGYVAGDTAGNIMLFSHVIPAALLSIGGILQLLPQLRQRYPQVHRWNGRMFLTLGLMGALSGLYLTWVRGSRLSDLGALGITLNGLLIPVAVFLAWHYARAARFDLHKRFAVHAFLLINGVWTFRLYLMAWYIINQGPRGNTDLLDGPTDLAISFACYGLPMLVAELVFWAQRQKEKSKKWCVTLVMSVGCLLTLTGVVAASLFMWMPRLSAVLSSTA